MKYYHYTRVSTLSLLMLTVWACSSHSGTSRGATDSGAATADAGMNQGNDGGTLCCVLPPVIKDIASLAGTTVQVTQGRILVIRVPESDPSVWKATLSVPSIATFNPGKNDGSATFNPGFTTSAVGTATVTMTNGATTVSFTLEVAAN